MGEYIQETVKDAGSIIKNMEKIIAVFSVVEKTQKEIKK